MPDQREHHGQYHNSLLHGHGSLSLGDGRSFVGSFNRGRATGFGTFVVGGVSNQGYWEGGELKFLDYDAFF